MIIAKLISIILHPFLLSTGAFAIILYYSSLPSIKFLEILAVIFIATVIAPLIQVYTMKKQGKTSSLDIPEREKRITPFLISTVIYLLALGIMWLINAPTATLILMWAYAFNTTVATIITRSWKISIHSMALGGPIAALGMAVSPHYYWAIPLFIPLLYSRVTLKAHTIPQVIAGFTLGFILTVLHFILLG